MKSLGPKFSSHPFQSAIAILCAASLAPGSFLALAQGAPVPTTTAETASRISNDQLNSLVAPIALYPDPLLSQILVASTYPLEMIQLQQWMERNKNLKDKALADAVQKQNWDPSIQAMVAFPEVVQRMAGNIQWTTDLGNAFLSQQADVMTAVQQMRVKAQGTGNLKTNEQQKVETQVVQGGTQVIVIEQANPSVIYIPSYDPRIVYGVPVYPYPPYYYPGYIPGMGLAFGAGLALGIAWGGGWGYHCGWGGNSVNINTGNTYVNHYNNINNINNINRGQQGNNNWQHNPAHRGGAPYGDRGTADRFGGRTPSQQPGNGVNRPGNGLGSGGGATNRPGNGIGNGGGSGVNRPGDSGFTRPSTLPATRPSGGDRIGNRNVSPGAGYGSNNNAFGSNRSSRSFDRTSSARGASSMGGRSGGGGGGGNRGGGDGGNRGGGGRR